MSGMGNDANNNNLGLGTGMSKEEMEWHLVLIAYEIMGWDWATKQTGLDG